MADDTQFHVGTSGFSYAEWQPAFYPAGLKKASMLSFYAEQLPAVELNNTFYRMPTEKSVRTWSEQVPDGFRFAVKAPRYLSWSNRLIGCEKVLDELFTALSHLGPKLGCVFYQVPKFMQMDLDVLKDFLEAQPTEALTALDFMHESWDDPAVFELLLAHGATAVRTDVDGAAAPVLVRGAPWTYLRLRRSAYAEGELLDWRDRLLASGVRTAFVFFKHEDSCAGPVLARRFLDL